MIGAQPPSCPAKKNTHTHLGLLREDYRLDISGKVQ